MSKILVDDVLPICCAAYRFTGGHTNNRSYELLHVVTNTVYAPIEYYQYVPCCEVLEEDISFATEIKEYCLKHLTFSVLGSETDDMLESWQQSYERKIYKLLSNPTMTKTHLGNISKLPGYYMAYKAKNDIKRKTKFINPNGTFDDTIIIDKECEVVHVIKTKNYTGYNITGIIDECLVSWYSPYILSVGNYKIEKAIVGEKQLSYYADKMAYRLKNISGYLIK